MNEDNMEIVTIHTLPGPTFNLQKGIQEPINGALFTEFKEIKEEQLTDIMTCPIEQVQEKIFGILFGKYRSPKE